MKMRVCFTKMGVWILKLLGWFWEMEFVFRKWEFEF